MQPGILKISDKEIKFSITHQIESIKVSNFYKYEQVKDENKVLYI